MGVGEETGPLQHWAVCFARAQLSLGDGRSQRLLGGASVRAEIQRVKGNLAKKGKAGCERQKDKTEYKKVISL